MSGKMESLQVELECEASTTFAEAPPPVSWVLTVGRSLSF